MVRVQLNERFPLLRDFVLHKDCINRAFRLAQTAVNTLVWVDEKLCIIFTALDTVNRANRLARAVLDTNTGLRNYKRHLDLHLQGRRFAESMSSTISLPLQNYNDARGESQTENPSHLFIQDCVHTHLKRVDWLVTTFDIRHRFVP